MPCTFPSMGRALLIDDDIDLLASYEAAASARSLPLETASTWDDGLNAYLVRRHDLVIADYNMPGSRMGLRLLVEIRRANPGTRLVLLSGFIDEADIAEVERLGLADKAIIKSLSGTADEVIAELRAAAEADRSAPTDWRAVAEAYAAAAEVTDAELDALDAAIARKVQEQ